MGCDAQACLRCLSGVTPDSTQNEKREEKSEKRKEKSEKRKARSEKRKDIRYPINDIRISVVFP